MTRLRDKISVEPLAPGRVARIEERVLAAYGDANRAPARARQTLAIALRYLAPAAAVCGVGFAVFLNLRAADRPDARPAAVVAAESTVTSVVTGAGESTRLRLGDAEIAVGAETSIDLVRSPSGEITIELANGQVDCDVEPRPGRAPFSVRAGEVAVTVVGTAFRVERDEMVRVRVTRGRVHVDSPDGDRSLAAGQEWSGRATRLAMAQPPAATEAPSPQGSAVDAGAAHAVVAPKPELHARAESKVPDVPTQADQGSSGRDQAARADRSARTEPQAPAKAPVRDARAAARTALPSVPDADLAAPREKVGKYLKSIDTRGESEREALYRAAYLELFVLHDPAAAIEIMETFHRRFRRGAFTEDMLCLRILATCGKGEPSADCRKAAHAYLARFPSGKYAALAYEIVDPM